MLQLLRVRLSASTSTDDVAYRCTYQIEWIVIHMVSTCLHGSKDCYGGRLPPTGKKWQINHLVRSACVVDSVKLHVRVRESLRVFERWKPER